MKNGFETLRFSAFAAPGSRLTPGDCNVNGGIRVQGGVLVLRGSLVLQLAAARKPADPLLSFTGAGQSLFDDVVNRVKIFDPFGFQPEKFGSLNPARLLAYFFLGDVFSQ